MSLVRTIRGALLLAVITVVGWIIGLFVSSTGNATLDSFVGWMSRGGKFVGTATEGVAWTLVVLAKYPVPALILVAVVALPAVVASLISMIPRNITKDPQRMFTSEQRRLGAQLADDRCEMEGILFTRCHRKGEHGDHWFPHSKGGKSTMNNFVWACAPCNLSKSARIPTWWETTRLEWRRRKYFDPALPTRPGEKVKS